MQLPEFFKNKHTPERLQDLAKLCGGMAFLVLVALFISNGGFGGRSFGAATALAIQQGIPAYDGGYPMPLNCKSFLDPFNSTTDGTAYNNSALPDCRVPSPFQANPGAGKGIARLAVLSVHPVDTLVGQSAVLEATGADTNEFTGVQQFYAGSTVIGVAGEPVVIEWSAQPYQIYKWWTDHCSGIFNQCDHNTGTKTATYSTGVTGTNFSTGGNFYGSVTVTPPAGVSTTYTLNYGNGLSASVTVVVPSATIFANPAVSVGSASGLNWTSSSVEANSCSITQTDPSSTVSVISVLGGGEENLSKPTGVLSQLGSYVYTMRCISAGSASATFVNGPTVISGHLGQAITFNGTSQYLNAGSVTPTIPESGDITVSAWIKKTLNSQKGIVDKEFDNGGTNYGGWGFWTQANGKLTWWEQGGKDLQDSGPNTLSAPTKKITSFTAIGGVTRQIFITSANSPWTVPADWNNNNNTIEVIGGGGGGSSITSTTAYSGGGGGGGAYSKVSNISLTPGASVSYVLGGGGAQSGAGGDTYLCNSTSNCSSISGTAVQVGAKGGSGSSGYLGGAGGSSASGVGTTKFSGGNGGNGINANVTAGGGGGGGSAGPNGNGGSGGSNVSSTGGSGGGGANGGANGVNGASSSGGAGGNGRNGTGGGAGGGNQSNGRDATVDTGGGGGGGGNNNPGGLGAQDTIWSGAGPGAGSGGGGGGGGIHAGAGNAAINGYGGGGGGGGQSTSSTDGPGGVGDQGIIVITYVTGSTWIVPSDWNNSDNSIEVIGGGAGGKTRGGGGGGGAYSKISNITLTPGTTLGINVGAGGASGVNGADTFVCSAVSNCASIVGSAVIAGAKGGATGSGVSGGGTFGGSGGSASSGIGSLKYNGGNGATGAAGGSFTDGGGGGGGAGGPFGNGGSGGVSTVANYGGTGGGGNGGGANGSGNNLGTGGAGGNAAAFDGNGTGGTANSSGGSGAGGGGRSTSTSGGNGGNGSAWATTAAGTAGSGGGGGGGARTNGNGGAGGLYGGGGGGGGYSTGVGGAGGQGIAVISYTPTVASGPDWNHVVAVWHASTKTVDFYINGTLNSSVTDATIVQKPSGSAPLLFGAMRGAANPALYLDGSMDDVRIYDRALSSGEVSVLYGGTNLTDGLTGYWSFDNTDTFGSTAFDTAAPLFSTSNTVALAPPDGSISYKNFGGTLGGQVNYGETAKILWSTSNIFANSCGVDVTSPTTTKPFAGGDNNSTGATTPIFDTFGTWRYTLSCLFPSGSGNNGSLVNGIASVAGKIGQALSFDGVSDYVRVPDSAGLDLGSQFTIAAWVKSTHVNAYYERIIDKAWNNGYALTLSAAPGSIGVVNFNVGNNGVGAGVSGTTVVANGGTIPDSKTIYLTTLGTNTWTVPSDWSVNNKIEVLGAGGGGGSQNNNRSSGGGGGAYSSVSNLTLTPGSVISYGVGGGGGTATAGGDTWFVDTGTLLAKGGGAGVNGNNKAGGAGGAAASGSGSVRYNGGTGGPSTAISGGGGGAAGPNGDGNTSSSNAGGSGDAGFGGAGGAGGSAPGTPGTAGSEWDSSHGSGGGGGAAASTSKGGSGGLYGAGGGGAVQQSGGGLGQQGLIVIKYVPAGTSAGVWHHVLGTFNSGDMKLYVDGVLEGSGTAPFNAPSVSYSPVIKTFTSSGTFTVPGGISSVNVLVVGGGGGGGGRYYGGGGGGGGVVTNASYAVTPGSTIPVIVGIGGAGGSTDSVSGSSGGDSSFGTLVAGGGGGGDSYSNGTPGAGRPSNGSGGGSGGYNLGAGGTGSGTGHAGGAGANYGAGGGGGAGANGAPGDVDNGGAGGAGVSSSISGSALVYGSGGGGSAYDGVGGEGGPGAGRGADYLTDNYSSGFANRGGGGGGSEGEGDTANGGNGGSGVVILTYTSTVPDALSIGADQTTWPGHEYFQGSIDDVRIYNRVLTSNEIKALSTSGSVLSGLSAFWPFDTTSIYGTTALDLAGGGIFTKTTSFILGTSTTYTAKPVLDSGMLSISFSGSVTDRVHKGDTVTVSTNVTNLPFGSTCSVSANPSISGFSVPFTSITTMFGGWVSNGTAVINSKTTFTLSCKAPNQITSASVQKTVNLIPTVQEI